SANNEHNSIFLPDGNKVFWSLPDEQTSPTSAVCWNAGVECTGGPGTYDDCHSVNLDVDGNAVSDGRADQDAVMRPMSRYISLLQGLEQSKQQINPGQEVLVAAIAGVPMGYPNSNLVYQDSPGGTQNDP